MEVHCIMEQTEAVEKQRKQPIGSSVYGERVALIKPSSMQGREMAGKIEGPMTVQKGLDRLPAWLELILGPSCGRNGATAQ